MLKKSTLAVLLAMAGIGLAACDVDKTQEGDVKLPEYEVKKTEEGNITTPKVDVTPPDVSVTEKEKTIEVPTIETEKKTVEVPSIDIDPAKENNAAGSTAEAEKK